MTNKNFVHLGANYASVSAEQGEPATLTLRIYTKWPDSVEALCPAWQEIAQCSNVGCHFRSQVQTEHGEGDCVDFTFNASAHPAQSITEIAKFIKKIGSISSAGLYAEELHTLSDISAFGDKDSTFGDGKSRYIGEPVEAAYEQLGYVLHPEKKIDSLRLLDTWKMEILTGKAWNDDPKPIVLRLHSYYPCELYVPRRIQDRIEDKNKEIGYGVGLKQIKFEEGHSVTDIIFPPVSSPKAQQQKIENFLKAVAAQADSEQVKGSDGLPCSHSEEPGHWHLALHELGSDKALDKIERTITAELNDAAVANAWDRINTSRKATLTR